MVQKGRPRGFDEEELLGRAIWIFWRRGYRQLSLQDLERELGLSRSSLYNAFGSKQGLFLRALDRYAAETGDRLLGPLERGRGGLMDVDAFLRHLEAQLTGESWPRGCLVVNSMVEFAGEEPAVVQVVERYLSRFAAALGAALQRAARRGEIAPDQVWPRAGVLVTAFLGFTVTARAGLVRQVGSLITSTRADVRAWGHSPSPSSS